MITVGDVDGARNGFDPASMLTEWETGTVSQLPDGRRLRTFYHSDYFRSVERHAAAPRFTAEERELLDLYEEIASSPEFYLDMNFAPGDVQLISNHTVLHARTEYEDWPEPGRRRHLLRLWLSLE